MSLFRGFIAVEINAFPTIYEFTNDIKKTGAHVKLVDLDKLHVTLKFLGDVEEKYIDDIAQCMTQITKDMKPFTIHITGTGVFPNEKYVKVLWVGMNQEHILSALSHKLNDSLFSLGFSKEKKSFTPHLTIARVKSSNNKEALIDVVKKYQHQSFGTQTVHCIVLKKSVLSSTGPMYTTLYTADFS